MEIFGQMALKPEKQPTTRQVNILYFNVNFILGTQNPRRNGYRVLWKLHKQESTIVYTGQRYFILMAPLRCCSFNCGGWNSGMISLKVYD